MIIAGNSFNLFHIRWVQRETDALYISISGEKDDLKIKYDTEEEAESALMQINAHLDAMHIASTHFTKALEFFLGQGSEFIELIKSFQPEDINIETVNDEAGTIAENRTEK